MDAYILIFLALGALVLLTAWLPMLLKELPLSLPIFAVGLGAGIFALPWTQGIDFHPARIPEVTEHVTEILVLVALTGCGLKLDRPLRWAESGLVWRLLLLTMPLTIVALAWLGSTLLGLGLATAVLLAGALAPTDPVLASDVQVGAPGEGKEDEIRFTLTTEAGLNDGLAFPFIHLAIALAAAPQLDAELLGEWLALDVLWRVGAGAVAGWLVGASLGWLAFRMPNRANLARTGAGFVALGIALIAYSLTELIEGYGFMAVFVAALAFRAVERNHDYHGELHDFVEALERLLLVVLLVFFGASITGGGLFREVDWAVVAFALVAIFIVRPLAAWISFLGRSESALERLIIGFFGIRGVGSFYYLAYGLNHAGFDLPDRLWGAIGVTVLISVVLHGAAVTPVMRRYDEMHGQRPPKEILQEERREKGAAAQAVTPPRFGV
ncbi:MAG TPA: cation:proton antiporter [Mesorhizobium sp.]|jgi:NhaP-type Na+/H+ or K+/H+ antiporter|nr:cation:proton antiporter [Mesorhizobium sp.]